VKDENGDLKTARGIIRGLGCGVVIWLILGLIWWVVRGF
jgi:hypothetical protein